jgi:YesN/AraC family two-component response regulator
LSKDKKNILYVDDEDYYLVFIEKLVLKKINNVNFNTYSAKDVVSGVNYIKNYNIDVLITDIRMVGLNGYEMAVLARHYQPSTKIISFSNEFEVESDYFDYSLSKSNKADEIIGALTNILLEGNE